MPVQQRAPEKEQTFLPRFYQRPGDPLGFGTCVLYFELQKTKPPPSKSLEGTVEITKQIKKVIKIATTAHNGYLAVL